MDDATLVILAALVAGWALVAVRLESAPISGPMVMMAAGVIAGPDGLGWLDLGLGVGGVRTFLSLTLALVLFSDASHIEFKTLRKRSALPARLLGIGLPLTIAAGLGAALVVFGGLDIWAATVLAVVLAPTDAALGLPVVDNLRVPGRVREGLNIESGLNDGVAVPLFILAVAGAEGEYSSLASAIGVVVQLIGWAVIVGAAVGALGAAAITYAEKQTWSNGQWAAVATPMLALGGYGAAEWAGGSGFVAAFVAGVTFSARTKNTPKLTAGGEVVGHVFTLLAFVIFGAVALGPVLGQATWAMVLYAVLSLTIVRMAPVALSLIGTGFRAPSVAFMGWFGPRGLASVIFAAELLQDEPFADADMVAMTAVIVVAISIVAHGATAAPMADRYADWAEAQKGSAPSEAKPPFGVTSRRKLRSSE